MSDPMKFQIDKVSVQIDEITTSRAKDAWEDAKRAIDAFFEVTQEIEARQAVSEAQP